MAREARHFVDEAVLMRIFSSNLDNRTTGTASQIILRAKSKFRPSRGPRAGPACPLSSQARPILGCFPKYIERIYE